MRLLCRSWYGYDPRLLRRKPRQRNLRCSESLSVSELAQRVDKLPVGHNCFRLKTRQSRTVVVTRYIHRPLVDVARQIGPAKRSIGDEADSQLFANRNYIFKWLS